MISKFYYGRIVYCEADLYSTLQKHISGRVFHSDLKNSVADITISPQSHVAFFLPLLSSWFLQNIFFLNSPLHPFLSPLSNFFTTHILESVSFFRRVLFLFLIFIFQSPYYWPSQHHTPDNIEWVSNCLSRLCWFDISKNPSTSVDISKTVSVDISRYAIYLYKRGQRNKKIHGLEPGLPVCSLFSLA